MTTICKVVQSSCNLLLIAPPDHVILISNKLHYNGYTYNPCQKSNYICENIINSKPYMKSLMRTVFSERYTVDSLKGYPNRQGNQSFKSKRFQI